MHHLGWGLQITVLGMGLVFALLALLWALLTLVRRLDRGAAGPEAAGGPGAASPRAVVADDGGAERVPGGSGSDAAREPAPDATPEPALVAAITAALLAHMTMRRKEAAPPVRMHWPGSLLHASRWVSSGRLRQNRTFRKGR